MMLPSLKFNIAPENWWLGDDRFPLSSPISIGELFRFWRVHVVTCSNGNLKGERYDHVSHIDFKIQFVNTKNLSHSLSWRQYAWNFPKPIQYLCIGNNIIPAWPPCETPRTPVISVDSTACHVIKDVVNDFRMRGETKTPVEKSQGFDVFLLRKKMRNGLITLHIFVGEWVGGKYHACVWLLVAWLWGCFVVVVFVGYPCHAQA